MIEFEDKADLRHTHFHCLCIFLSKMRKS